MFSVSEVAILILQNNFVGLLLLEVLMVENTWLIKYYRFPFTIYVWISGTHFIAFLFSH